MNTEHSWTRRSIAEGHGAARRRLAFRAEPRVRAARRSAPARRARAADRRRRRLGPSMVGRLQGRSPTQVNAAGGIGGQKVEFFVGGRPDQSGRRRSGGAQADRHQQASPPIMGVWSSGVAAPTLPICWENKVAMLAIAASDTLAELPHQGYFIRTNVHVALQGKEIGEWAVGKGAKSIFVLLAQTPVQRADDAGPRERGESKGVKTRASSTTCRKTSFRSEVDQALAHEAGRHLPRRLSAGQHHHHEGSLPGRV